MQVHVRTDELEPEAKDEIMEEAGIPKEQQKDVSLEDAITAAPAADTAHASESAPAEASKPAAIESLEAQAPVPNVNFSADNA